MDNNPDHDSDSPPSTPSPAGYKLPITPPKSQWYKRKLLWVPVILIVIVAAGAAAYAFYASFDTKPQPTVQQSPKVKPPVTYEPQGLVYASTIEKVLEQCLQNTDTVHFMNLKDQKSIDAVTLDDSQSVSDFATYHDLVVLATTPSCASEEGARIWLSQDSGKTYKKIFAAEDKSSQITSVAFSTDGHEVIFGLYLEALKPNVVKAIDIKSSKVNDLFTGEVQDLDGILKPYDFTSYYIQSYDRQRQRVYYVEGCYMCDMAAPTNLLLYDLKSKKSSTAIERAESIMGSTPVVNDDATKAVRVSYITNEATKQTTATISEFDLSTEKQINSVTYTGSTSATAGYTDDGLVYYTAGDKIMTIASDGKASERAQLPGTVFKVHYVSKSHVIYQTNDQQGGEVIDYDIKSGKPTSLLDYKYPTAPYGVSYAVAKSK